jgi:hypothetical protein
MFDKKLLAAAAASGLMAVVSAAWAQTAYEDALPSQQTVEVTAPAPTGQAHILYFVDQGNSPETDPAAHLMLIKDHQQPQPVAQVEEHTVVAQAEPSPPPAAEPAPAPAPEAAPQTEDLTEKSTAPDQMPAPRADRN